MNLTEKQNQRTKNLIRNNFDILFDNIIKGFKNGESDHQILLTLKRSIPNLSPQKYKRVISFWFPELEGIKFKERTEWVIRNFPMVLLSTHFTSKLYDPTHPIFKYYTRMNGMNFQGQKAAAKRRGIDFQFDFVSWISWWIQTGKFDERGVYNHSYQMCRKGDTGPYSWDNVYCDTRLNNKNTYFKK